MSLRVLKPFQVKVCAAYSQVSFLIDKGTHWVKLVDKDPLSKIEFSQILPLFVAVLFNYFIMDVK